MGSVYERLMDIYQEAMDLRRTPRVWVSHLMGGVRGPQSSTAAVSDLWILSEGEIAQATNNFSEDNRLGSGGYGKVFKGKLWANYPVAIKHPHVFWVERLDEEQRRIAAVEVKTLAKLRHPYVLNVVGCAPDSLSVVTDFMPGKDLHSRLKAGQADAEALPWRTRLRIAAEVAHGLVYVHSKNFYHRNIKPENVLLSAGGVSKIADFGLVKSVMSQTSFNPVGTPGYVCPHFRRELEYTEKGDVYSLGLTLLQLITGTTKVELVNRPLDELTLGKKGLYMQDRLNAGVNHFMEKLDGSAGAWSQELAERAVRISLRACCDQVEHRPYVKDIAGQLEQIRKEAEIE